MRVSVRFLAVALVAGAGICGAATVVAAGSSSLEHGVRVHRLIAATAPAPDKRVAPDASGKTVVPHRHAIRLQAGKRVIVTFADGIGRSRYRRRHPGIARPWSWKHSAGRRDFAQPRGLYTSKIYRRGYY